MYDFNIIVERSREIDQGASDHSLSENDFNLQFAPSTPWRQFNSDDSVTIVIGNGYRSYDGDFGTLLEEEHWKQALHLEIAQLVNVLWGAYVIVRLNRQTGEVSVFRDPSGSQACYYVVKDGKVHIFSGSGNFGARPLNGMALNEKYLAHYLAFSRVLSDETAFSEIKEVIPGRVYNFHNRLLSCKNIWSPAQIANRGASDNPAEIRSIIARSVASQIRDVGKAVMLLSGGLDSCIVLSCCASEIESKSLIALNIRDRAKDSDERKFAQAMAERAEIALEFGQADGVNFDLSSMFCPHIDVRPSMAILALPVNEIITKTALAFQSRTAISGKGGDNLFFAKRSELVASDIVWNRKFSKIFRYISNASRITRQPLHKFASPIWRYGVLRKRFDPMIGTPLSTDYLSESARASLDLDYLSHPWIREARNLPAGKMLHIRMIADMLHYRSSYANPNSVSILNPLVCQPIIERFLALPTYQIIPGHITRGLVRASFEADLPREVIERQAKGGSPALMSDLLISNKSTVREMLLDGKLRALGILDGASVEDAMREPQAIGLRRQLLLMEHLAAEVWARRADANGGQQ